MSYDPIVDEIHAIREAYAKRFNYDLEAIYRYFKECEIKSDRKFVSLSPKRIQSRDPATVVKG